MEEKMKLSVCVVARNAAHLLPTCLSSLSFADEIVVALDRCEDNSLEVARKYSDRVFEIAEPFENARRSLAESYCRGDWVLMVDADESVPADCAEEILKVVQENQRFCYALRIKNVIAGHYVKHGWGCYIGAKQRVCLYPKGTIQRISRDRIHPNVDAKLPIKTLSWYAEHDYAPKPSSILTRLDWYTTERAKEIVEQNLHETFGKNVRRVFSRFFKCYVISKGYKEGHYGFLIALLAGMYPIISYLKAKIYQDKLFED